MLVRILKNKTTSNVTISDISRSITITAGNEVDLAAYLDDPAELRKSPELIGLLGQGEEKFELSNGKDDLSSDKAIELIRSTPIGNITQRTEMAKDLTQRFTHRHKFYWSTFYRILIYQMILILTPAFIYHYAPTTLGNMRVVDISFILSIIVLAIVLGSALICRGYLKKEDYRVKLVVTASRKIYDSVNIDLNPDAVLTRKQAGLGNSMSDVFFVLCAIFSIIVTVVFGILSSS